MLPRRDPSVTTLLLLTLAAGCARPQGGDVPADAIVRALDHVEAGIHEGPGARAERKIWFRSDDAESAGGPAWWPLDWSRPDAEPGEAPEGAELVDGRNPRLGPAPGAWLRVLPVEPGARVRLDARVVLEGLGWGEDEAWARLGLLELESLPRAQDLASLLDDPQGGTWSELLRIERGAERVAVELRLAPETRAVGIACVLFGEQRDDASVTFEDLQLGEAVPRDRLAEVAGEPELAHESGSIPVGAVDVGLVTRPAVVLGAGDRARIPLRTPDVASRFETWLGLPPPLPGEIPAGEPLELSCSLVRRGTGESLALAAEILQPCTWLEARWREVSADLPEDWQGAEVELVLEARGSGAEPPPAFFGTPRLVPSEPQRPGPNLVLVSVDTLRADHVGCYGYERDTTPNLDALARDALLVEDVWAPCSFTLPSHMSLFSGQLPSVHGVQDPFTPRSPQRTPLLAEVLAARGWTTGAFTGGGFLHPAFDFHRGFERYSCVDPTWDPASEGLTVRMAGWDWLDLDLVRTCSMEAVESWIADARDESFFLFLHTYAAHDFDPPARFLRELELGSEALERRAEVLHYWESDDPPTEEARELLTDLYDGGIRQADEALGRIVEALKREGVWEDTILVVTSDHGQEIGERGALQHGRTLYEELLDVPLVIRVPGRAPARETRPAMLVDVFPTLLELLDVAPPGPIQGLSLLELAETPADEAADRVLLAEVAHEAVKSACRRGAIKTILSPLDAVAPVPNEVPFEVYDLAADPLELQPLEPDPEDLREVERTFEALRELRRSLGGGEITRDPGADVRARLAELGYARGLDR